MTKGSVSQSVSSVTQPCPTLWDPMDYSTLGLPIHHQLPEFTQTHVQWVNDAIQSSHPFSSPSAPTFNLSQHQGLFKWVSSSHQVAKLLQFQLQRQSFQWIFRKIKSVIVSTVSPSLCHEGMEPDAMILVFWMLSFKPTYPLSSFTFFKRLFSSSLWRSFLYSSVYSCHLFLIIFCFFQLHTISVLYCAYLCMKCSLGISDFLEETSSLSHSIVSLYFFALITEEDFLISPCYSLELCIQMGISFLFSFAFCFSSFLVYF